MVAIVTNNGLGLFNSSLNALGGAGAWGQGALGQAGGRSWVNAATGNLVLQFQDEQLSGTGLDLFHVRTYNSLGSILDADNDGWRWDGERKVLLAGVLNGAGSTVARTLGDGHRSVYSWNGSAYVSNEGDGAHDSIVKVGSEWLWTDGSSRHIERYDYTTGKLKSIEDTSGNVLTFGYSSAGKLNKVSDSRSGQSLEFVYNSNGQLARLDTRTESGGVLTRQVYYSYDGMGRLTKVRTDLSPLLTASATSAAATDVTAISDSNVYTTTYTYAGSTFRVASISQGDGTSVAFTYELVDSAYRVKTVTDASGTQTFTYDVANLRTDVTNGNGLVWSYYYDAQQRLTEVKTPTVSTARLSTQFQYDGSGNVTQVTDARGNSVVYEYDGNGNRTLERDALGNTVTRTYNTQNQLVIETRYLVPDSDGAGSAQPIGAQTIRYAYDPQSRLRFVISAEGRVSENRYNSNGLLEHSVQYTGNAYDISTLTAIDTLNESQLTTWVSAQDKSKVQLSQYEYDYRGNASKRVDYASVDTTGNGTLNAAAIVNEYIYSEHGQLLQTIVVRGAARDQRSTLSSVVYDGMGRQQSVTNASGTQTYLYDGANRKIAVATAAGLTVTQAFDDKGRLLSVSQSDGSSARETKYVYDAGGRLRMVQDALGARRYTFYDDADRIAYQVDSVGTVIGFEYNATGQLLKETRYFTKTNTSGWYNGTSVTKLSLTKGTSGTDVITNVTFDRNTSYEYDNSGRLTKQIDAANTAAITRYDGLSRLTEQQVSDRLTRYFYDQDGLLLGIMDGEGYLISNKYNGNGQLIQRTEYLGTVAPALRTSTNFVEILQSMATAAPRSSYWFYDAVGRVVGEVDQSGWLTETLYDEVSNKQSINRYEKGVAVAATDTFASYLAKLASSAKHTDIVEFDSVGRITKKANAEGTVTQYEYDAAGRLVRELVAAGQTEVAGAPVVERGARLQYNAFGEVTGTLGGIGDATLAVNATAAAVNAAIASYGVQHFYNGLGQRTRTTDANGYSTWFYYDSEQRLTHTVNAMGEVRETKYDAFGQAVETMAYANRIDPSSLVGVSASELIINSDPTHDQRAQLTYDKQGKVINKLDEEGYSTAYRRNLFGEVYEEIKMISSGVFVNTLSMFDKRGLKFLERKDSTGVRAETRMGYSSDRVLQSIADSTGTEFSTTVFPSLGVRMESSIIFGGVGGPPSGYTNHAKKVTKYDSFARVLEVVAGVSPAEEVTKYSYNDANRTITVTTPEGAIVSTWKSRFGETVKVVDGRGNETRYEYDKNGQLKRAIDGLSRIVTENIYDNAGRLTETVDANGTVTHLDYDAANRVIRRTVDPTGLNLVTEYVFDAFGRQITVTEGASSASSKTTQYTYDRKGLLTQIVVDPSTLQLSTTYKYDGLGNVVRIEQGTLSNLRERVTEYTYNKLGHRIQEMTDPDGMRITTQYRYDTEGRLTRKIDANGNSTWYLYNGAGWLSKVIDSLGSVLSTEYDNIGRVTETRQFANRLTPAELASFGDVVKLAEKAALFTSKIDNVNDGRTYFVYDKEGRQRYVLNAIDGGAWAVSETRYDKNGNVTETRRYDKKLIDSRVAAIAPSSITITEMQSELVALGYSDTAFGNSQRTRYAYDANNRPRFVINAVGAVSENTYDESGRLTASIQYAVVPALSAYGESDIDAQLSGYRGDLRNRKTEYVYDAAGRQRFVIDAEGGLTEHRYNSLGQLTERYQYDVAIGTTARTDADLTDLVRDKYLGDATTHGERYQYDKAGRLRFTISAIGAVNENVYDAVGNLIANVQYAAVPTLTVFGEAEIDAALAAYRNDPRNRSTRFVYDAANRQRFTINAEGYLSETKYDNLGRAVERLQFDLDVGLSARTLGELAELASAKYLGDATTRGEKYQYDNVGRLLQTTDAKGYIELYQYDSLGNRNAFVNKNGHRWDYTYDKLGRLTYEVSPQVAVQLSDGTLTNSSLVTALEYDALGNLSKRHEAYGTVDQRTTSYEYDRVGRRTRTTAPGWYDITDGRFYKGQDSQSDRVQLISEVEYNSFGNITLSKSTAVNDNQQLTTVYQYSAYDNLGRIKYEIDALGYMTGHRYNAFGEEDRITRYAAKPALTTGIAPTTGALDSVSTAASRTIVMKYDALGRKIEVSQPEANSSYFSSGAADRNAATITAVTGVAATPVTKYEFNTFNEVHREQVKIDDRWADTWHYYDELGRETRTINADGYHTRKEYDAFGNVTELVEYAAQGSIGSSGVFSAPSLPGTSNDDRAYWNHYNQLNQLVYVRRTGISYYQLDGGGYVARNEVPVTVMQSLTYDGMGNVLTQTDALSNVTTTEYNALGQVTKITEPARATASNALDPFVSQVSNVLPVTTLTLNAFGQVVRQERSTGGGRGETLATAIYYDYLGNAIETRSGSATTVNNDTAAKTLRAYDHAGRVIKESQSVSAAVAGGAMSYNNTIERRFRYDLAGRQTGTFDVYTDLSDNQRKQSGQLNVYNGFGEVTEEWRVWGSDSLLNNSALVASYLYDTVGRVKQKTAGDGTTTYYYNLLGQMTRQEQTAQDGANTVTRITETAYDKLGRAVMQRLPVFDAITAALDTTTSTVTPYTTQTYDRWGNVKTRSQGGYVLHNADDSGTVVDNQKATIQYRYNHDNQVIAETLPTVTVRNVADTVSTYQAMVTHEIHYDVLGRAVEELDTVADDAATAANEAATLRTRRNEYNSVGQLVAQRDATGIKTEYVYDANGNKVGTKNNIGQVFVSNYDAQGQVTESGLLQLKTTYHVWVPEEILYDDDGVTEIWRIPAHWSHSSAYSTYTGSGFNPTPDVDDPNDPYDSYATAEVITTVLNRYEYDLAGRRHTETDALGNSKSYRYDDRGNVIAARNETGITTTYAFNEFGQKTREQNANTTANTRTWNFNLATGVNYQFGQLADHTDLGGHVTTYDYNGFGQLKVEHYKPTGTTEAGTRSYSYLANGLLLQSVDHIVIGSFGGRQDRIEDYESRDTTTTYGYTVNGERAREHVHAISEWEQLVVEREPGFEYEWMQRSSATEDRDTLFSYDAHGRLAQVKAPRGSRVITGDTVESAELTLQTYYYDELSNRRLILSQYKLPNSTTLITDFGWYAYDAEGRITLADGQVINEKVVAGAQGGTAIRYDSLGRRHATATYKGSLGNERNPDGSFVDYIDRFSQELYGYDDLGRLTSVDARIWEKYRSANAPISHVAAPNISGTGWVANSRRSYDAVGRQTQFVEFNGSGNVKSTTKTTYFADGRNQRQDFFDSNDKRKGLATFDQAGDYDAAGNLLRYRYQIYNNGSAGATQTYTYSYGAKFESYQVSRIDVTATSGGTPGATHNTYDQRGNLIASNFTQNSDQVFRTFSYDSSGHILTKTEKVGGGALKSQDYVYFNGNPLASIGNISGNQLDFNYTPVSDQYPSSTPGQYIVADGDTLAGIAQAVYGDAALWYLIADANSLSYTPEQAFSSSDVGKNLKIPNVISNIHNDAGTFKAYNSQEVIGDLTPTPVPPPPPKNKCEALVNVVSVVIGIVVGYFSFGLGAGAGPHSRQVLQEIANGDYNWDKALRVHSGIQVRNWRELGTNSYDPASLGMTRTEIDYKSVGIAAAAGYVGGAAGNWAGGAAVQAGASATTGAVIGAAVGAAAGYATSYGLNKAAGNDVHWKNSELLASMAAAAVAAKISGGEIARDGNGNAYVKTPLMAEAFEWSALARAAAANLTSAAVNYGVRKSFGDDVHWNGRETIATSLASAATSWAIASLRWKPSADKPTTVDNAELPPDAKQLGPAGQDAYRVRMDGKGDHEQAMREGRQADAYYASVPADDGETAATRPNDDAIHITVNGSRYGWSQDPFVAATQVMMVTQANQRRLDNDIKARQNYLGERRAAYAELDRLAYDEGLVRSFQNRIDSQDPAVARLTQQDWSNPANWKAEGNWFQHGINVTDPFASAAQQWGMAWALAPVIVPAGGFVANTLWNGARFVGNTGKTILGDLISTRSLSQALVNSAPALTTISVTTAELTSGLFAPAPISLGVVSGSLVQYGDDMVRLGARVLDDTLGADAMVLRATNSAKPGRYIPLDEVGNPVPLAEQATRTGQGIPLPHPNAEGPHTVIGSRLAGDGETIYRQTATFPGDSWPPLNGQNVPWGRVDWTAHEYLPGPLHPSPHIHEFRYDSLQKTWVEAPATPFFW